LDLYPADRLPALVATQPGERPEHPAVCHLRRILAQHDALDELTLKRISAGYYALVTHLDEQIGQVLSAVEEAHLLSDIRIVYSSDHGDSFGNHYILGKFNMYERSVGVPLIMAGPGVPQGYRIADIVSHVDLFPTLLESFGHSGTAQNGHGRSLWRSLEGSASSRIGFAEYHGLGSLNASYMLREGMWKLVYHVGMPPQLFSLRDDPEELNDLGAHAAHAEVRARLEHALRCILDPETTDARAKAEQRAKAQEFGGTAAILARGGIPYTPPPGTMPEFLPVTEQHVKAARQ
jgi:choline-sulfatase